MNGWMKESASLASIQPSISPFIQIFLTHPFIHSSPPMGAQALWLHNFTLPLQRGDNEAMSLGV